MVPGRAALRDGHSFNLLVLPGANAPTARFDPTTLSYVPTTEGNQYPDGVSPFMAAATKDAFTLVDLRPIRPLVLGNRAKALDADLVRFVHGFDAVLVMSGSTASHVL